VKSRTATFNSVASRLRRNFSFSNVISVFREQMKYAKGHRGTKLSKLLLTLWVMIKESKSPWYYWYTGSRIVAVQAWIVSFLVMCLGAVVVTGGAKTALIYILIGIALESVALVLLPILLLIDFYMPIPDALYHFLLIPVFVSAFSAVIIQRVSMFVIFHSRDI
jgi:hypothetical protein